MRVTNTPDDFVNDIVGPDFQAEQAVLVFLQSTFNAEAIFGMSVELRVTEFGCRKDSKAMAAGNVVCWEHVSLPVPGVSP